MLLARWLMLSLGVIESQDEVEHEPTGQQLRQTQRSLADTRYLAMSSASCQKDSSVSVAWPELFCTARALRPSAVEKTSGFSFIRFMALYGTLWH